MKIDWLKKRWLEYRWGLNYVNIVVGIYQLTVLTALILKIDIAALPLLLLVLFPPFAFATWILGVFHKKYQLNTDAVTSYQPIFRNIEEIMRRVYREERARDAVAYQAVVKPSVSDVQLDSEDREGSTVSALSSRRDEHDPVGT